MTKYQVIRTWHGGKDCLPYVVFTADRGAVMKPYRFSFTAGGTRHAWIRFYDENMEQAFDHSQQSALYEYPDAHAFAIESDQDDMEIRRSWGLV